MPELDEFHPDIQHYLRFFRYDHLPEKLQRYSKPFAELAVDLVGSYADQTNPEIEAGLRKLLEAKDCFVRAAID